MKCVRQSVGDVNTREIPRTLPSGTLLSTDSYFLKGTYLSRQFPVGPSRPRCTWTWVRGGTSRQVDTLPSMVPRPWSLDGRCDRNQWFRPGSPVFHSFQKGSSVTKGNVEQSVSARECSTRCHFGRCTRYRRHRIPPSPKPVCPPI